MRRVALLTMPFAVLLVLGVGGSAHGAVETTGSVTYVSKYIWRGWDLAPTDEPAVQGSMTVAWPSGWGLNVWGSYAMDSDSQLDELDYTLSYTGRLTDDAHISTGVTHYTFPSIVSGAEAQTKSKEAYVCVYWPDAFLAPSLAVYEDWEAGDGTYVYLRAGHDFNMRTMKGDETVPPLTFKLGAGYNNGQWGAVSGISDVDLGLSMTFTSGSMSITPAVNYVIVPEDTVNTDNEFWFGLGVGFNL